MRRLCTVLLLAGIAATAVACAGADSDVSRSASSPGDADQEASFAAAVVGDSEREASVAEAALAAGRDIVVVGSMSIEVEDLAVAQPRATAAVEGLSGFIASEQSSFGEQARSTVTYRLPADKYEDAVRALGELGEVLEQTRQTEDVSTQLVDLESRLATARASVARLRSLFDAAVDLSQVALLEGELLKREAEVETLAGSLRALEDRVALSTLVVTWQEAAQDAAADESDELPTFIDGLAAGWRALLQGAQVGSVGVGFALPFLPIVLVVLAVQRVSRRFRRPDVPAA